MFEFHRGFIERYRLGRLVEVMTRNGLDLPTALQVIRYHRDRGTVALLEQEWLS
jgi:hypothetical protein